MALNPSPQRQSVVTFPTPNVNDILFFENVDAERVGTDVPEYGTKHPDSSKWPDHRLVYVESADPKEQNRYYRYYYAADQSNQDDDNWSHTEADIGGTKFDAVSRDYIVRRSEFNPDSPAMGSSMPDVPEGKFSDAFVLAERRQIPLNDKVLNGLYVVEQRVYVKKVPLSRLDFDEFFQTTNETKQILYYKDEVPAGITDQSYTVAFLVDNQKTNSAAKAYWGMTDGVVRTVQQLSDNWYAVTEQEVVKTEVINGRKIATYSYGSTINYSFPPILEDIDFREWPLWSGGVRTYPKPVYKRGAFRGPCEALVTVSWTADRLPEGAAGAYLIGNRPEPEPITIVSPLFSLNIPPTLHEGGGYTVSTGDRDETYRNASAFYEVKATNVTEWEPHVASATTKPFRGGWLVESITVQPPALPALPAPPA